MTSSEISATTPPSSVAPASSAVVSRATRAILLVNLIAQTAIVVTGGLVRLTGSGLGCPTWPECVPGSYTPVPYQAEEWHALIEFGNRVLTFALVIITIATFVAVLRHRPRRRALLLLAAVPFLGTMAQAVLGGITVITGLNPWTVASHFLVSMGLIAGATVLYVRGGEPGDGRVTSLVRPPIRPLAWALVAVAGAVVVLGTVVTGSGPHSGDAETPNRIPIDPRTIAWLHADVVLLFLGLTVGLLIALVASGAPRAARVSASWVLAISVAQGVLGYTQYFTGLPWAVVLVHQLGACLVWIAVIRLLLATRDRAAALT